MKRSRFWQRFAIYMNPIDGRYEELNKGNNITGNVIDDLIAGLVVASVAIPVSVGFAMASGLRPEQGIIGGAVATLLGAIFGGSKYQVYGPTAAFIPVIAGLMATYDHGFLVLASILAGIMLLFSGFLRLGYFISRIPHSIVIGFTIGIVIIIAFSQVGHVLGLKEKAGQNIPDHLIYIYKNAGKINIAAITMAAFTILFCRTFEKISNSVPSPVPALVFGYFGAQTFWSNKGLTRINDQYGGITQDLFSITLPRFPQTWTYEITFDLFYYAFTFFLVAAIESIVCGRAADRLADNQGFPFSPNRELRGQGMINIFSPLFNGFPHTGALGRMALSNHFQGRSPLAAIAKAVFTVLLTLILAKHLGKIPMSCLAGIILYIAGGMAKKGEIKGIVRMNNYHVILMLYTAAAVPLLGPMIGLSTVLIMYAIFYRIFQNKKKRSYLSQY
jgi:MFS superfamily sulfate permease-like transporter